MKRIVAAVDMVIAVCISKAGKPLLWCLILYFIGLGALSSGQNTSFVSMILAEFKTIGEALWYLIQYWVLQVEMPPSASFINTVNFERGDGSWAVTLSRIIAVWPAFLLLLAFSLATLLRIVRLVWGGIPRPFVPWLCGVLCRLVRLVAAVRQRKAPEMVIDLWVKKAGKLLLGGLVLYFIGLGALSSGQNTSFVSVSLAEFKTIGEALWYLIQTLILRVEMPPHASFFEIVSFDRGAWSWTITVSRIITVWATFLLLIAFSLASLVRILRAAWGSLPRPFWPWLWGFRFRRQGRFATPSQVAIIRQPNLPPRR